MWWCARRVASPALSQGFARRFSAGMRGGWLDLGALALAVGGRRQGLKPQKRCRATAPGAEAPGKKRLLRLASSPPLAPPAGARLRRAAAWVRVCDSLFERLAWALFNERVSDSNPGGSASQTRASNRASNKDARQRRSASGTTGNSLPGAHPRAIGRRW